MTDLASTIFSSLAAILLVGSIHICLLVVARANRNIAVVRARHEGWREGHKAAYDLMMPQIVIRDREIGELERTRGVLRGVIEGVGVSGN